MVKFYHGTDETSKESIKQVGLLPANITKKRIQPYIFITHKKAVAQRFGKFLIEFDIPRSKIYTGNNEIAWKRSGKPVWDKDYKPEALAYGIPKKYIKAVITPNNNRITIGNREVKI